jgi:pimeloyl-ACP methyl ester carboxylesterase
MEWIDPQGAQLSYTDHGEGKEVLLFIHGLTDSHETWWENILFFSKYYRCIAINLPGHGSSKANGFSYDLESYVQKVKNLIEYLQLDRVVLVGHSMGGQISIQYTDKYPQEVSRLILSAPAGLEEFSNDDRKKLLSLLMGSGQGSGGVNPFAGIRNYFFDVENPLIVKARKNLEKTVSVTLANPAQVIAKSIKGMLEHPVSDVLPRIKIPVCIFFGTEDNLIPNRFLHPELSTASVAKDAASLIKDVELHLLESCGHMPHLEKHTQFNLQAYKFLNRELYG